MFDHALYLSLLLLIFLPRTPTAQDIPAYTAVDLILLSCGSPSNSTDLINRTWETDANPRYMPANFSSISQTGTQRDVPYRTVRIFNSNFTYSFPVSSGHKFIRLHFSNDTYSAFNSSQPFFSVIANGFTLLSNFSPSLNSLFLDQPFFFKEFIINVDGDPRINLTFSPNPNSFAFINGIEIVSLPDDLYFRNSLIKYVPDKTHDLQNNTALEMLYRLNVGGLDVPVQNDSGPVRGMFRSWTADDGYIFGDYGFWPHDDDHLINYTPDTPPYSAPKIVYRTSRTMANTSRSLEWAFPVDSGFLYLLRFHFCEIQLEVTKQQERVFTINIDNKTAEMDADVIFWTGGTGIPIFKDYINLVPNDGRHGKKDIRLSLFPYYAAMPKYSNALLNGLEIFKLSDSNQNLAAPNPDPPQPSENETPPLKGVKNNNRALIYAVIGSVIGVLAVVAAVSFFIFRRRQNVKDSISSKSSWVPVSISRATTPTSGSGVPLPSDLCRHFTLREIIAATSNFDDNFVIGRGGFGNVYKGSIDNGATTVAVKRLNASSNQGAREFLTEIEMLSKLRHLHLVSLIGYCIEHGEMILVYDYMAHGTLRDHLYNTENAPLNWKQRLKICLGAAKGIHYLHTGAKNTIIHRDVKSTNILLDEKWVAKMSDFGLSKAGKADNAYVTTAVKGSVGYLDPEYWRLQQLTEKSDVYSFGVVLFEVLCARPAVLPNSAREKLNLAEWVKLCYRKGMIDQIVDSNLKGQIAPECLNKYVETAISCLRDKGIERPAMNDVVWSLEFVLQLQEAADKGNGDFIPPSPPFPLKGQNTANTTEDDEIFSGTSGTGTWTKSSGLPSSGSSEKLNSLDVFSEIRNPTGR